MTERISITQARKILTRLPEQLTKSDKAVEVTRHGKSVLAILSWESYQALIEAIALMGYEDLASPPRDELSDNENAETETWEALEKDLGL